MINKMKKSTATILALALILSVNSLTAFAMTPEEKAAVKRIENKLDNATFTFSGSQSFGSASNGSTNTKPSTEKINLETYAKESIALANAERVSNGLHELVIDEDMMTLAAVRAREISEKWGHERLDGTCVTDEYRYAEIITIRSTPQEAVNAWMESTKGHKEILLKEKYNYVGAGCYQAENGKIYWVQLFSK